MSKPKQKTRPRHELMIIERKIFEQNKRTINDSVEVYDKGFKQYQNRYNRAVKTMQKPVQISQVLRDISKSNIVLVGDYHTLDQSQRSFVRVLRSYFKAHGKKAIVALETVQKPYQRYLNQLMLDGIDSETFIKKIGFKKHWFFDLWKNYEVIFDFLKFHEIPTFAIEAPLKEKKSLKERDEFMADEIVRLTAEYPDRVIFVLVGDLHLASEHLPKEIARVAKRNKVKAPTVTTLFQNSEAIYWHLSAKEMVDHTLVVKIKERSYCRMHTPPLIVQQSYMNWLYHEEGRFDWIDAKQSFINIVERIAHIVGFKLPADYENIEVYTCGDLGFMKILSRSRKFTKKELQFIRRQIENSESYLLPKARIAYIANVSIHHAAEEASHYLKILLSGEEFPRSYKDAFYANVMHEAIGFFGSKLINSKRKCPHLKDFKVEKQYLELTDQTKKRNVEYETALLFMEQDRLIGSKKLLNTARISNLSSDLFLSICHALGYDLGERLYYAFMDGKIKKELMQDLYTNPFSEENEPGELYLELMRKLRTIKRPPKE